MGRKEDLEKLIRKSYGIIRSHEESKLTAEPEQKISAQMKIERQWENIQGWLEEYSRIPTSPPEDILEIAAHFPEFVDRWLGGSELLTLQDAPPRVDIFIGREREKNEFKRSLSSILNHTSPVSEPDWAQVFLVCGEGGMGKSTLLGEYVRLCEERGDNLFWLYVDWEFAGVDSQGGTKAMMRCISDRLQSKYQEVTFPEFNAEWKQQQTGRTAPNQLRLSQAFVTDLVCIAHIRPIVMLFDTYEVIWHFADQWIREGLYRHCLSESEVGKRFLFAIAGRLPPEVEPRHRDAVRRYAYPLAYFYKTLDSFTEDDIRDFLEHKLPDHRISDSLVSRIHTITMGIPLAVSEVATIIRRGGDIEQLFGDITEPLGEHKVVALVTQRLLKHLERLPEEEQIRELDYICTLAVIREGETAKVAQRERLLMDTWLKCRLINSTEEFYHIIRQLQHRYSFILPGYRIHSKVRSFLRRALHSGDIGNVRLILINQEAKSVCKIRLKKREKQLEDEYGEEAVRKKYRDQEWQEWLLDLLNHLLWLQEYDDVIELLAKHYIWAMRYRSEGFHKRLLNLVERDELLYNSLPMHHRGLVQKLAELGEGLGWARIESEMKELLELLGEKERQAERFVAAKKLVAKGDFDAAERLLREVEDVYRKSGERDPGVERDLAFAYLSLGRKLARSSKRRQIQQRSLKMLERAQQWLPDNPHIHSERGKVLTNLLRLEEAKLAYERAQSLSPDPLQAVAQGLERIRRYEVAGLVNKRKQARILAAEASALSSLGEFGEAEKLFKRATEVDPSYIPARVKLAHLLRQIGNLEAAKRLLDEIPTSEITERHHQAILHDAYGALYLAMEQFDRALQTYQQAIELAPEYINPHNGLGKVHIRLGEPLEAIEAFEKALRLMRTSRTPLRASFFWVYNGRGIAYLLAGQRNGALESFQIAELRCRRQIHLESRQYHTWAHLGLALLGQQQYDDALRAFEQFARICSARGMIKEVLEDVNRIVSQDESDGWRRIRAFIASLL